jgi:hypothetical protein
MSAVYEKARAEGYPKARAAKIGWGAVKRAGYDFDELYAFLPRRSRILTGARRLARRIPRRRTRPRVEARTPPQRTRAATAPTRTPSYIADPARLVKPIDIPGYDNLNNVRFVPRDNAPGYYPTRGLVEGQIVLPQHQFLKSLEVIEGNPEYDHVELTDENGDGYMDRFVVRGPKDASRPKRQNVGLFVDIAKPLKTDRLLMENWSLT